LPQKKKQILSEDFIRRIVEYSGGYFKEDALSDLFSLIEKEAGKHFFTYSSESNLLRLISAVYDKVSFLSDCLKYPHYMELAAAIASNSNYLTDILVRNPGYFYLIANPSNLEKIFTADDYKESAASAAGSFNSLPAKVNALRRYKRKEILRIGSKDIFLKTDIKEVTRELSCLARAIASELFSICYNHTLNKYGLDFPASRFCLAALGKLGGNELNYSSDIDLLIFYDENKTLQEKKEYQEILTETTLLFIESASSITENGYLYRVDFRLRPDGRNSPLCRRLADYLIYYESRGEDWERQMLIKSDFIAGSADLFGKFKEYLIPFIFPSSFKTSPIDQIRRLKLNIEKNLKSDDNIKLIPGGIRDIEFSVQALQLINGGKIGSVRSGNTLTALDELHKAGLLSDNEAGTLRKAYIFYRKIEHYLQLMNDTQTHLIPPEGELLNKLSFYSGFRDASGFLEAVEKSRIKVLKIYRSVTGKAEPQNRITDVSLSKFSDSRTVERDIAYLREGKGLLGNKEFDKQSMDAFDKISDDLIYYLKKSEDPETTLNNFVRIIRHAKFPSIWYEEFRKKEFFHAFLSVCEYSQLAVDLFAEDKSLSENFLSGRVFNRLAAADNLTYKEFIFQAAVQFTLGIINSGELSFSISSFFQKRIKALSYRLDEKPELLNHYFIGSMGSLGSGEMTFTSDIDIIFITDNLEDHPGEQKIFIDFLTKLREEFKPVIVDCRLRPEGKGGMLVWDAGTYKGYIYSRARTWELQALTKLKFTAGNKKLFSTVVHTAVKRLKNENADRVKSDIKEMRRKMLPAGGVIPGVINLKKNSGGITDIEFIIQYLILCNPLLFQKLRAKNINKTLELLAGFNPEHSLSIETLIEDYIFLKTLIIKNQNIFNHTNSVIVKNDAKFRKLAAGMGFSSEIIFEKKLAAVMKDISSIFSKIFGR